MRARPLRAIDPVHLGIALDAQAATLVMLPGFIDVQRKAGLLPGAAAPKK